MIRPSVASDKSALQTLWQVAFGDPPEATDVFFSELYEPGDALVWDEDGEIVSAIYLLDAGTIDDLRVSYSYALATLPAYRGRGLGSALTQAAITHSAELDYDCNLICPAEESLFGYYERLGYTHTLPIAEGEITYAKARNNVIIHNIMSTNFETYAQLRQSLLPPSAVAYPEAFLHYAAPGGESSREGLYRLELEGQIGCAAVERRGGRLFVKEILPATFAELGTQALLEHFDMESALYRTVPENGGRPFVLVAFAEDSPPTNFDAYFPFALD